MESEELSAWQVPVDRLPYRRLFVTVSGAHLYGFPSPDSDVDLRGVFLLPLPAVVGLRPPVETVTATFLQAGREIDLVAHDLKKFLRLLLDKNGYVLEQLYSPLVVEGGPELAELRALARGAITRHVYHHYAGFARHQRQLLTSAQPPTVKLLLYLYRVLLTGIWLLRTGEVEAHLPTLNQQFGLPFLADLIAQKRQEHATLPEAALAAHEGPLARLQAELEAAFAATALPDAPATTAALEEFLIRLRLERR